MTGSRNESGKKKGINIMQIKTIYIHCSASPRGRGDNAATIHQWHKEKDWAGIGYHYVITEDNIEAGRPEYWNGAHVRGHNRGTLGICLIGTDDFTDWQYDMLAFALAVLKRKYPGVAIKGHYESDPKKTCPNFDVPAFLAKYNL